MHFFLQYNENIFFKYIDECSNPEPEQEYEEYKEEFVDERKYAIENIPGLDLSDPKQLAEFARFCILIFISSVVSHYYIWINYLY